MDRITLKHYLERAEKGKAIVDRINMLKAMKARIEKTSSVKVTTRDDKGYSTDFNLSPGLDSKSTDPFIVNAEQRMILVLFEEIDSEVSRLESELAEL